MIAKPCVATLVAPAHSALSTADIECVVKALTHENGIVQSIRWLKKDFAADVFFTGFPIWHNNLPFDVIVQPEANRRKKILIADMESTIIEQEMLDELAGRIGLGQKVSEITYRAMNGELGFEAALKERVNLLKGRPEYLLREAARHMTLTSGARDLVAAMKKAGAKTWLVSGGFTFFVKIIAEDLGFDRFYANELITKDGIITGEVALPILGKDSKKSLLEAACCEYEHDSNEVVAVGDGANDVPMLLKCCDGGGLGVAYHAKPKVRDQIHIQINKSDLSALIYAQNLDGFLVSSS